MLVLPVGARREPHFRYGRRSFWGWLREVRGGPAENMLKQARQRGRTDKPATGVAGAERNLVSHMSRLPVGLM